MSSKNLDNSVAFVDVITNGLGGMLVLFFVAVVVQISLEWHDEQRQSEEADKNALPFVVLVKSLDETSCFDTETEVWNYEGVPSGLIDSERGTNKDWGPRHALLVVRSPLNATRASLRVRPLPNYGEELQVEVYPAGAAPMSYRVPVAEGDLTEVWPCITLRSGVDP